MIRYRLLSNRRITLLANESATRQSSITCSPPGDRSWFAGSPSRLRCGWLVVLALLAAFTAEPAPAQFGPGQLGPGQFGALGSGSSYPSQQYYLALEVYRNGDLPTAIDAFDAALGQARVDSNGRWIDSIPALAMLGECHWQLGNLPMAMSNIDAALQLAVRNRGWLTQVDFSSALMDAVKTPEPNSAWAGTAAIRVLSVSSRMQVQRGEIITEQRVARGGSIESINRVSMDVAEVMRGIAIALHRRRIILGDLSKDPPVPAETLEATKYPQNLQVPIGRTLIGAVRAVGRYADLDDVRALTEAPPVTTLGGGIHPLTPIVLLCHAETLAASARPTDAVPIAIQAAQSAAALGQTEWVGEALQLALGCSDLNMLVNVRNLATGAAGAYGRNMQSTTLAALLVAAEAALLTNETAAASTLIQQAQTITGRRGFTHPRLTAYGAYVTAMLGAVGGQPLEGPAAGPMQSSLAAIKNFTLNGRFRNKSVASNPSLYQLALVSSVPRLAAIDKRTEQRLRYHAGDPPAVLWRRDPVEAIGWLMQDRTMAGATLLGAAVASGDSKQVITETDAFLRRAFADTLPLAGRLQNIRTLATADKDRLGKVANDFLKQPPAQFAALRQAATAAEQAAVADPVNADTIRSLEAQVAIAALARQNYPDVFLPALNLDDLKRLPERTGIVVFTVASNRVIATLASADSLVSWSVGDLAHVNNAIGKLLKEIGVGPTRGARLSENDSWRTMAAELRRQLLTDTSFDASKFDNLVVVPAGPLWYLPLEILPAGGEAAALIGEQLQVRYAPTPALALEPAPLAPAAVESGTATGETAIAAGLFFAPRDAQANADAIQSIVDNAGLSIRLPLSPPVPSGWLSPSIRRFVVGAPRAIDPAAPLAFVPLDEDNSLYEGSLAGWLAFPNHSPESVVMPGFRTSLGTGRLGDGSELFMTLTALHAAGVRDIMLSRWAVGGQSTAMMMRELVQELPHSGMQAAWQRSVLLLRAAELDPETEPLLGNSDRDVKDLTGDPPLFWASYLIDAPVPLKPSK